MSKLKRIHYKDTTKSNPMGEVIKKHIPMLKESFDLEVKEINPGLYLIALLTEGKRTGDGSMMSTEIDVVLKQIINVIEHGEVELFAEELQELKEALNAK